MNTKSAKIHWSRRVAPHKIRRLYESDAQGMLDEGLLNDVGYGIYARCRDILEVSEAFRGKVRCRSCGNIIERQQGEWAEYPSRGVVLDGGEAELLKCDRCSWQIAWGAYARSLRGTRRLDGSGVEHLLTSFVQEWPSARSPSAKLLLIDKLIHEFHVYQGERGYPLGVNVIKGTAEQVYGLLEKLAYGTGSTAGLEETRRQWYVNGKHLEYSRAELQAIARELEVKGYSGMRKAELVAVIERIDPKRFRAWEWENRTPVPESDSPAAGQADSVGVRLSGDGHLSL